MEGVAKRAVVDNADDLIRNLHAVGLCLFSLLIWSEFNYFAVWLIV